MKKLFLILSLSALTISSNVQCTGVSHFVGKVVAVFAAGIGSTYCAAQATKNGGQGVLLSITGTAQPAADKATEKAIAWGIGSVALAVTVVALLLEK